MKTKYRNILWIALILLLGMLLGYLFWGRNTQEVAGEEIEEVAEATTWTCSMHPQIRQPEPGQCPICGMDLIPLSSHDHQETDAVVMTEAAARLADIRTIVVQAENASAVLRLNGKIVPDESLVKTLSAHISGRVEQLLVNTTGEKVEKGQILARVYSPELISAQQELLQTYQLRDRQPALYEASREKLRALRMGEKQIDQLIQSGEIKETSGIYADRSGIVMDKKVQVGDYLQAGQALYTIADLSRLWVIFDAYEKDLPFLKEGDQLSFTVASLPGQEFTGEIDFIDPIVDPATRTTRVRVVTPNPQQKLKPQMFTTARIQAGLGEGEELSIPKSAVMWTGERSVVYVKQPESKQAAFELREIVLGPSLGDSYIVKEGLKAGEEIVVKGTFTVDAAAQLAGKSSMMNPEKTVNRINNSHNHEDVITSEIPVNEEVRNSVWQVLQAYLELKESLIASDPVKAGKAAAKISDRLEKVPMSSMEPEFHSHWMKLLPRIEELSAEIKGYSNLAEQRLAFISISEEMETMARMAGPFKSPVFIQFCPMANNNQGAEWLSLSKEVKNPYFGEKMLNCGEVNDVIR